jgi:hypothetical protein
LQQLEHAKIITSYLKLKKKSIIKTAVATTLLGEYKVFETEEEDNEEEEESSELN